MAILFNFDESNTYTLKTISELYNTHFNLKRIYHFQYKTEESAVNFGNFSQSILDTSTHHTIHDVVEYHVTDDKRNLILKSSSDKVGAHTIAYSLIPDNYRFDIISSALDGKTLVIYDKNIKKPEQKVDNKVTSGVSQSEINVEIHY